MSPRQAGARVYVYGSSAATVVLPDPDGAVVRELDDSGETWFPWSALTDTTQSGVSW